MHKIHRLIITDINEDCFVSKLFRFVIIDAWFFPFFYTKLISRDRRSLDR